MRRREFIALAGTLIGGVALAWSHAAQPQPDKRIRRIGVMMPFSPDDVEGRARLAAFAQKLEQLGWAPGRDVQIDTRWAGGHADDIRKFTAELLSLAPDVILANSSATVAPLLQATRSIPVVFTVVADPVGAGYVESLGHPGGNITGFTNFEYSLSGKWLELLKEIAPQVTQAIVLRDSDLPSGVGQFGAIQAVASSLKIELRPVDVRDAGEIKRAVAEFAKVPAGGVIVTGSPGAAFHRELIVTLAARYKLPAVYNSRFYATAGGLISYGPDFVDQFRHAAGYVSRILKGEKPGDLPVQTPTRYDLVINLKTAAALGIAVPPNLVTRADEVIEA
jgi:putative ABC transport system substrate-binding protein